VPAIVNNGRQRELQDSKIAKAFAGIDQAKAQIAAAEAGKDAVAGPNSFHARSERKRQEGLYQTHSATQQTLETAVANDDQISAQLASRDADLDQAQTMLRSSELGAEAERRSKAVLESQDMQLQARSACETGEPCGGYSKSRLHENFRAPATALWANAKSGQGNLFLRAHR